MRYHRLREEQRRVPGAWGLRAYVEMFALQAKPRDAMHDFENELKAAFSCSSSSSSSGSSDKW